ALRRRSFVDEGALHVELVDVDALGALRVRDRGAERLGDEPCPPLGRILEEAECPLDRLASDQVDDEPRLLRGDPHEAALRARLHHAAPGALRGAAGAAGAAAAPSTLPFRSPECPWNVRVGANSPSLCPTAFSVMNTGMNFRPLCTAKVKPTMSGVIVDRRDHVFTTRFSPDSSIARTFFMRCASTNGPFLTDRATPASATSLSAAAGSSGPCAAPELSPAALAELHVVHRRAERDVRQRQAVARLDVRLRAGLDLVADAEPDRRQDVALLPVRVVEERDPGRAVRIVLDGRHPGRHALLLALEVHEPVEALVPPAPVPDGHPAEVVPAARLAQRRGERGLRRLLGDLVEIGTRLEAATGRRRSELDGGHPSGSLEEVDAAPLGERHVGLLPVRAPAEMATHAPRLAEEAGRPHLLDLHLEERLDGVS